MIVITKRITLLTISAFLAFSAPVSARVVEGPPPSIPYSFQDPLKVLNVFLTAVDRGELLYFGKRVSRKEIVPIQVEYVYKFDNPVPLVEIYSEFKTSKSVPRRSDCSAAGISAVLNSLGEIVDSTVHIWPIDEAK